MPTLHVEQNGRMVGLIAASVVILLIAALIATTGRGGANFYVSILVACGLPMLQASLIGSRQLLSTER